MAVYAAESHGIRVGLCEQHLKEQVADLEDSTIAQELAAVIETDR